MSFVTLADNNKAIPSPFSKGRQHRLKFQSILSEAAKLFNWQGSRATTLADIAGSMNLTKTCLYYYVNNKQDLIYYCYVASCDLWLEAAEQSQQLEGSGLDKVVAMVEWHFDRYMQTLQGRASHPAMLAEVSSLDPAHAEDIQQRWSAVFKHCQAMVEEGIEDGSIVGLNAEVIVLAVLSVVQWLPVWMNRTHAADVARVIEGVVDILVHGLAEQTHIFADISLPEMSSLSLDNFDREVQNRIKREAFYRVGAMHFNQKGYKGTSLDEIAAALDVTKGAFYYHIKNKEELLYQCFRRSIDIERQLLLYAGEVGSSGLQRVELALRYLSNLQHSTQGPLIRYRALPSLDEQHRKHILKSSKQNTELLGNYINAGITANNLRSVDVGIAQHLLSGAVEASPDLAVWVTTSPEYDPSVDYFKVFINGLSASPRGSKRRTNLAGRGK